MKKAYKITKSNKSSKAHKKYSSLHSTRKVGKPLGIAHSRRPPRKPK